MRPPPPPPPLPHTRWCGAAPTNPYTPNQPTHPPADGALGVELVGECIHEGSGGHGLVEGSVKHGDVRHVCMGVRVGVGGGGGVCVWSGG